jgi:hypothetical protein
MTVRATRWFLITAPVVAGILVLIFGTAGSISTTFGIVLIGIGPIVWMWNWLIRMSFVADDRARKPSAPDQEDREAKSQHRVHRKPTSRHPRKKLTRTRGERS